MSKKADATPQPGSYTVLARRYRSRDFDEVVGQETIAATLRRAIDSNRLAHAYLFCGTRGVGKTSMARIFAKALNVHDGLSDAEAIARAIMEGSDLDTIEIDGASHNSVEEARELIANCVFRPARCPYKIYIIDEVHMLSTAAFNALLKTMEEPPEHVKFILCTTEPQKVPATIQSRCQRFDFRNIPTRRIADHLKDVLKREKIEAEPRVILDVARLGAGSMRDALSILDRLLATSTGGKLTHEDFLAMLGRPERGLVEALVECIAAGDASGALAQADEMIRRGQSYDQLLELLLEHLHMLMILAACEERDPGDLLELDEEDRARLREQAQRFDLTALVHMIVLLENLQRTLKFSSAARALFDAAVVRLALAEQYAEAATLLKREPETVPPQKKSAEIAAPPPARPAPAATPAAEPTPTAVPVPSAATPADPTDAASVWSAVLARADGGPKASMLASVSLLDLRGNEAVVRITNPRLRAYLISQQETLAKMIGEAAGRRDLRITFEADSQSSAPAARGEEIEAAAQIPIVRKAMELFNARVIAVEEAAPAPEVPAGEDVDV